MKIWQRRWALVAPLGLLASLLGRGQVGRRVDEAEEVRLPSGKLQREELLKHDHQQNVKDAGQLVALATGLKADLEKQEHHVLSLATIKKTEEIERLARRIRSRMQRA